ncbi:hypothetical protein T492DRAFT_187639 [Pavlovales sp. CCMP2436]|nr:hypothetical protein T492DRAFT_187639 [Pavlovales sp. CCMP2436]
MLAPLLPLDAGGALALPALCARGAQPERASLLMLAKSLAVCGDAELRLATLVSPRDVPAETKALVACARCWVGPFALGVATEECLVEWLDKGAAGVLVTLPAVADPAALVEMLKSLPRERVCLIVEWKDASAMRTAASLEASLRRAAAPIEKAGKPLNELFGCILVRVSLPALEGGAAEGAMLLAEPLKQLGKALKLRVRLGFEGAPPSVGDAGVLHCAEITVHACVSLATPAGTKVIAYIIETGFKTGMIAIATHNCLQCAKMTAHACASCLRVARNAHRD